MQISIERRKRKTIAIKVTKNGDVIVLAPKICSDRFITNFIESKTEWITKTIAHIKQNNQKYEDYNLLKKVLLFGNEYEILEDEKHYFIGDNAIIKRAGSKKETLIVNFYKRLASEYLTQRISELSNKLCLFYSDVKIISARSRWGSCNNLKVIKLNYKLVMLPKELIDYVICHELVHLKELNHSEKFWMQLEQIGFKKKDIRKKFLPYSFVLSLPYR